jgi:hypothetical protein
MPDSAKPTPPGRPTDLPPRIIRREIAVITRKGIPGRHGHDATQAVPIEPLEPDLVSNSAAKLQLHASSALARAGEPLSVLEQLRQFLEAERRRARNRMLIMGGAFVVIMALACVAGYFTIEHFRSQVSADLGRLGAAQAAARKEQADAANAIGNLATRTELLRSEMDAANQLRSTSREVMETQLVRQLESLQVVRKLLSEVQVENSSLAAQYRKMNDSWQTYTNDITSAIAKAPVSASPAAEPPPLDFSFADGQHVPRDANSISLAIVPAGHDQPISWRMPLP